jgi:hypothetical protein
MTSKSKTKGTRTKSKSRKAKESKSSSCPECKHEWDSHTAFTVTDSSGLEQQQKTNLLDYKCSECNCTVREGGNEEDEEESEASSSEEEQQQKEET